MSYEFGNYNRDNDYNRYQLGQQRKAIADAQVAKAKEKVQEKVQIEEVHTEAKSAEALGVYGQAFFGMNTKKVDLGALGLTANDEKLVGKFVTPEQQARIAEDMLKFFS